MSYILIPQIEVFGANAQSAYTIISGPSPLAFLGMIRKLAIDCGQKKDSEKIKVAIIHHHLEMRGEAGGYYYKPAQYRGAALTSESSAASSDYVSGSLSMSLQPVALCNLKISLIISGLESVSEGMIYKKLLTSRCAGGHIRNTRPVKIFDSMRMAVLACGKGYYITERQDILNVSPEDKPAAMINALVNREAGNGWILPMNLGFLAVTDFKEKNSARRGFKHAYAEPLVGMIQYKTRRALEEEGKGIPFWRYQNYENVFAVTSV